MNQHIAGGCAYAANVSGFLKAASQNDGGIRTQMPMPRQAETVRQSLYAWRSAAKARVAAMLRHVPSEPGDNAGGKHTLLCSALVKSNAFKTARGRMLHPL